MRGGLAGECFLVLLYAMSCCHSLGLMILMFFQMPQVAVVAGFDVYFHHCCESGHDELPLHRSDIVYSHADFYKSRIPLTCRSYPQCWVVSVSKPRGVSCRHCPVTQYAVIVIVISWGTIPFPWWPKLWSQPEAGTSCVLGTSYVPLGRNKLVFWKRSSGVKKSCHGG